MYAWTSISINDAVDQGTLAAGTCCGIVQHANGRESEGVALTLSVGETLIGTCTANVRGVAWTDVHGALCSLGAGTTCCFDFRNFSPARSTLEPAAIRIQGRTSGNSWTFPAGGSPWCASLPAGVAAYRNGTWLTVLFAGTSGCAGLSHGWTDGETCDTYLLWPAERGNP